jgi:hypothetical protein
VTGYFAPDASGATYFPLAPTRLLDSRNGTGLSGVFNAWSARTFQVTGVGGVPAGATAVTGNLTVTDQSASGYLYVGPTAMNVPTSSTLNFPTADNRANAVTVALSSTGSLSVTYVSATGGATTDVVFDVTGYFSADMIGATSPGSTAAPSTGPAARPSALPIPTAPPVSTTAPTRSAPIAHSKIASTLAGCLPPGWNSARPVGQDE